MLARHDSPPFSSENHRTSQKRRGLAEPVPQDTRQTTKKRKLHHPSRPPPHFWANLSKVELTRGALRELDRLNAEKAQHHSQTDAQHCRPRTRRAAAARQPACEVSAQRSPAEQARLRRFARLGGPNLQGLRGYPQPIEPEMSSRKSSLGRRKRDSRSTSKTDATPNTGTTTAKTKSTGPYDRAFGQHLVDHDIFPPDYEYPDGNEPSEPENMDEIRQALERPRASLSPSRFSKEDFKKFRRADAHATKESRVTATVVPIIEGDPGDRRCVASEVPFSNLEHLTDGTLVYAKPDLYYGARPEQLNRAVRDELSNLIVPSSQEDLPVAPNNFLEVKGPDGSLSVLTRQALYDVTLGSRAMHALRVRGSSEPEYDSNAYALAWTYHGGQLKAFASHPLGPSISGAEPTSYIMTQIKGWSLTSDPEAFRQGAAAFRNGRDWAKEQRDRFIVQANERVGHRELQEDTGHEAREDVSPPLRYDSDTSADELSYDFNRPTKRSRHPEKQLSDVTSASTEPEVSERDKETLLTPKPNGVE